MTARVYPAARAEPPPGLVAVTAEPSRKPRGLPSTTLPGSTDHVVEGPVAKRDRALPCLQFGLAVCAVPQGPATVTRRMAAPNQGGVLHRYSRALLLRPDERRRMAVLNHEVGFLPQDTWPGSRPCCAGCEPSVR